MNRIKITESRLRRIVNEVIKEALSDPPTYQALKRRSMFNEVNIIKKIDNFDRNCSYYEEPKTKINHLPQNRNRRQISGKPFPSDKFNSIIQQTSTLKNAIRSRISDSAKEAFDMLFVTPSISGNKVVLTFDDSNIDFDGNLTEFIGMFDLIEREIEDNFEVIDIEWPKQDGMYTIYATITISNPITNNQDNDFDY